jgi:uncharacterized protein
VVFPSDSGSSLRGWFVPGEPGRAGILLLHGVGGNRLQMLGRARFLHATGYSVLLFDFQAHGESPGRNITFGHLEACDARAALDFLRKRLPGAPLGVIGSSLGGAAALVGPQPLDASALVLEAVYPTLTAAVSNRLALWLGSPGRMLTPLLLIQVKPRLGFDPGDLEPVRSISTLNAPVLLIAGSDDAHTTLADTAELFAAARDPKELWIVPRARHVDLHRFAGAEYERRVLAFFERHLVPHDR